MTLVEYFKRIFRALFNVPEPSQDRKKITKKLRDQVWNTYFPDSDVGKCFVCSSKVNRYNYGWHCSHVISVADGGKDTLENLRVCCPKCNLSMGKMNMNEYISKR